MKTWLGTILCLSLALLGCREKKAPIRLRLATTTSTRDSGLLDKLLPEFEKRSGISVEVIAVGTGKALKLGEAGDADVVLVHARPAEDAFMAAGHGARREDVMYNRFEIAGPPGGKAAIKGLDPVAALKKISQGKHIFISRGDDSGTHKKERALWKTAGGFVPWENYLETGQGMGMTLMVAYQKQAYVLVDRGTYLAFQQKIDLVPLTSEAEVMRNPYGVMLVNPARHSHIDRESAGALIDFFVSPAGQNLIADFKVAGERLFVPAAKAAR